MLIFPLFSQYSTRVVALVASTASATPAAALGQGILAAGPASLTLKLAARCRRAALLRQDVLGADKDPHLDDVITTWYVFFSQRWLRAFSYSR